LQTTIKRLVRWDDEHLFSQRGLKSILRFKLKKFLVGLHPHVAIRYEPVIRRLNSQADGDISPSVLEVGSGSLGVTRFWHHPVTGIDLNFDGPKLGFLKRVKGSVLELPFEDGEFQYVISIDMLEHLPRTERDRAVDEMLRVAASEVIIALPCGNNALAAEARARSEYQKRIDSCRNEKRKKELASRSFFLQEHHGQGLPGESEILSIIHKSLAQRQIKADVVTLDNESVWVWRFLLPSVAPYSWPIAILAKSLGLLLLPLWKRVGWGGFYRKYFIISKGQNSPHT